MGFLRRIFGSGTGAVVGGSSASGPRPPHVAPSATSVTVLDGNDDLEIVGESHYQDTLWRAVGRRGPSRERVRVDTQVVLMAEPQNEHDPNAVVVKIAGETVGYLSRSDAERYCPGLLALEVRYSGPIALRGVIAGGGLREDGYGFLGVFLRHNRADFDLRRTRPSQHDGRIDTGLSDAIATDADDETYDLTWLASVPDDPARAVPVLRKLLAASSAPIERHFIFMHLEESLYRCRTSLPNALDDYDECYGLHDEEMDAIRAALFAKWETVPRLQFYTQMCIRQAKKKDFEQALWWAERGLAVYGSDAARSEWLAELTDRAATYRRKLVGTPQGNARTLQPAAAETITCNNCGKSFERLRVRGRKPTICPSCRSLRLERPD